MKFFDAKVTVEHTFQYTETVDVTVQASGWDDAECLALKAAKGVELEATLDSSRLKRLRRNIVGVAHVELADFLSRPPERRFFSPGSWLIALDSGGVSNGCFALWTDEAKRIGHEAWEAGEVDGDRVILPEALRTRLADYRPGISQSRHPGWFAKRYVDVVVQLGCLLVGEAPGDAALVVDSDTRVCVGVLMPLKDAVSGAVEAPVFPADE